MTLAIFHIRLLCCKLTMMLCNRISLATLLIFFLLGTAFLQAASIFSDLQILETAVMRTIDRLQSDAQIDPPENKSDSDFRQLAGRQLEFSLLSLGAENLLHEDYYNFSLYLIARSFNRPKLARELLVYETGMAEFAPLKRWLELRINAIDRTTNASITASTSVSCGSFSINDEFVDLKKLLKKHKVK